MSVTERMKRIRVLEKIEKNQGYSEKIGIRDVSISLLSEMGSSQKNQKEIMELR